MESYFENNEAAAATLNSMANFAWDLFREINKSKKDQNVFFSPSSINIALAMTYLGARSSTKEQMKNVLKFNLANESQIHETFSQLIKICDTKSRDDAPFTLLNAQRLYAHSGYPFLPSFIEETRKYYHADVETVDFESQGEKARVMVNNWVKEQTKEKIPELLSEPIDPLTRLILLNAVYFKGNWQHQFDSENTFTEPFHMNDHQSIDVSMMFQRTKFFFGRSEEVKCEVAEIPYINDEVSMFIILPDEGTDIEKISGQIEIKNVIDRDEFFQMEKCELELFIPKFKLEDSIDLKNILSNLGMAESFSPHSDFSGMDGSRNLFIEKVVHKAILEVNEEGSEAAAATAMMMNFRMMPRPPMIFKVNRPFIFFIIHSKLNIPLFLGKLYKP